MKPRLGIDVGSTTVKLVVWNPDDGNVLYADYERHDARQVATARRMLEQARKTLGDLSVRMAVCGSGGKPVAEALGVRYIQEVVANAAAVRKWYPAARTAIELGGQDAKVVFFHKDEATGQLLANDMRMNGSCAGGTGAFIDEIATLLHVPSDKFEALAAQGTTTYDFSGRCGVFAKTDIQPLLLNGVPKADIALSTFHAIVKQTIGGLSQGLPIVPPVIFEGGPLTFNPTLVRCFAETLHLRPDQILRPERPECMVALGTAMVVDELFPQETEESLSFSEAEAKLADWQGRCVEGTTLSGPPFFKDDAERNAFVARHTAELGTIDYRLPKGPLDCYLGIDLGSTTSKFVLMDKEGRLVDRFYANNNGEPLLVIKNGLVAIADRMKAAGCDLSIIGLGTTGYGEQMLARAFHADYHTVETVAHTTAAKAYVPGVTFILDIGGQDMKAIWLKDGVITNIMLNEACSSGCGSFLENFARNLHIPVTDIARTAFSSRHPALLGSRCTVFMNSTIINAQRDGRQADDIMAGLCRSIIENVFTKVVRINSPAQLGDKVVVQGGTFKNFAVLKAFEDYLGAPVTLAPYPGEMGALGAALGVKAFMEKHPGASTSFIGLDALRSFSYTQESGVRCPHCANHCNRTIITFSTGGHWVTGNRCERGDLDDAPKTPRREVPDLYRKRNELLFASYPYDQVAPDRKEVVGIPRVLEFWDSMPFWTTFFKALGFQVKLSRFSSQKLFETGLPFVASDTICFPAKLVHGHVADLASQGVDRIFFPYVMHMPPEGVDKNSPYVCSVVQGYPMVVRNSQNPEQRYHVVFDTPVFHWFTEKNRKDQIVRYAEETLGATRGQALLAFQMGERAILKFRGDLVREGSAIIAQCEKDHAFAVVLAGRPYQGDPLVNHGISRIFTERGIPVLTVDSLPGLRDVDLKHVTVEITNDFHTRMLAGAVLAARSPVLEYAQIVSFGCGHDAILSDEIARIMSLAGKASLLLKVDESDATGALKLRIRSFIESVEIRRDGRLEERLLGALPDPYPAKFFKDDKKKRTVLLPNISPESTDMLKAIMEQVGFKVQAIPVGSIEQIKLGKRYVHNDICFPCQMVIGELIGALEQGGWRRRQDEVAVGMVKFQCDCRMSHYAALLRKALDRAGFGSVPVLTTDPLDTKDMHHGVYLFSPKTVFEAVWGFMMMDIIKELCRKIRPYEKEKGSVDALLKEASVAIAGALKEHGIHGGKRAFRSAIQKLIDVPYDRSVPKPRVFITGELLVTYHPGSNFHIERYFEENGMETIFPRMTDQLRKDFLASMEEIRTYRSGQPPVPFLVDKVFDTAQKDIEKIAVMHPLYEKSLRPIDVYQGVRDIIPETLSCGEGWLMASEIVHYAKEGVKSFIILQPFGCLPNHICGRGVIKRIKDEFPDVQILPLDLDPDTSFANVENRLQMMIMNQHARDMLAHEQGAD